MKASYRKKVARSLSAELKRLRTGTDQERQRYRNVDPAMAKVMADPLHKEFQKDLDNYKAVDVLQQYRLFFHIVNPPESREPTVHFVWMNNEESIHSYEAGENDCYRVFKKMLERGEIEPYSEESPPAEPTFRMSRKWGAKQIQIKYERALDDEDHHASCSLYLKKRGDLDYDIYSITESDRGRDLARDMMIELCKSADDRRVTLSALIYRKLPTSEFERGLLEAMGFRHVDTPQSDAERWQRTPVTPARRASG